MARAMRRIGEYLKLVDVVVEVADARVPRSGRNPALDALAGKRTRVLVLTREDLAEPATTKAWMREFAARSIEAVGVDARSQPSVARVAAAIARSAHNQRGNLARVNRRYSQLGEIVDRQRAAAPCRRQDRKSRGRHASTAMVSHGSGRGIDGYARHPGSRKFPERRRAMEARDLRRASARALRPRTRSAAAFYRWLTEHRPRSARARSRSVCERARIHASRR